MSTYTLYIGADNHTKKLAKPLIERILRSHFEGFTLQEATGYWQGLRERTAVVSVSCDEAALLGVLTELKIKLNQDAIAYQKAPALKFI